MARNPRQGPPDSTAPAPRCQPERHPATLPPFTRLRRLAKIPPPLPGGGPGVLGRLLLLSEGRGRPDAAASLAASGGTLAAETPGGVGDSYWGASLPQPPLCCHGTGGSQDVLGLHWAPILAPLRNLSGVCPIGEAEARERRSLRPLPDIGSRERRGRRREEPPQPCRRVSLFAAREAGPGRPRLALRRAERGTWESPSTGARFTPPLDCCGPTP